MYYVVKCVIVLNLRDVLLRGENSKYHSSTNNNIHVERKDTLPELPQNQIAKIVERGKNDTPNPHIHDYPLSLLDTTKKPMFKGYQRRH